MASNTPIAPVASQILSQWAKDPILMYSDPDQSREILTDLLQESFAQSGSKQGLVFGGFKLEHVWEQISQLTQKQNTKLMAKLTAMLSDGALISLLTGVGDSAPVSEKDFGPYEKQPNADSEVSDDGIGAQYGSESGYGEEQEQDESELDDMMQELEEDELQRDDLKMPSDDDMDSDDEESGEGEGFPEDNEGSFPSYGNEQEPEASDNQTDHDEAVEQLFEEANEANEMDLAQHIVDKSKGSKYVNQDMVAKIEQIEDEMMRAKDWQMTGEVKAKERPVNSLLEVHLDFNTATKLPPTITKETTNAIEALVKQRVLDELFDDPVLQMGGPKRGLKNDTELDFNKSKSGLGDLYSQDFQKALARTNPDAFLEQELSGADAPLKREIEDISKELFQSLDALSNFHFVPRAAKAETQIQTQNVQSLQLEDALPISVSKGQTKAAREVFQLRHGHLREKSELTKEEKQKERNQRKRKFKTAAHNKLIHKKEQLRQQGLQLAERFVVREAKRHMEKVGRKNKQEKGPRNTNSSAKVFANLQQIAKADAQRKEDKKEAKAKTVKRTFSEMQSGSTKKYML